MLSMLPGAVVTAFAAVGIRTASGPAAPLARFLAPAARPLLVVGTAILVAGALRCGRGPAALAASAGLLLYLSMYVLPDAASIGGGGMAGMGAPALQQSAARAGAPGATNAPVFYLGLAAFVATYLWSTLRRRRQVCRPALPAFRPRGAR